VSAQPSLEVSPISGTICNGNNIAVPFVVKNTDINKYNYSVEISDINGSFAKPLKIGNGNASPINAIIPDSISASNNYKIRVVANSDLFAYNNPQSITVLKKAMAILSGSQELMYGSSVTLNVNLNGSSPFNVILSDGQKTTTDKNVASFVVNPKETTTYTISVSNDCGLGTTTGDAIISVPLSTEPIINGLIVMPNPFSEELTIQTQTEFIGAKLFVINTLGLIIYEENIKQVKTRINTQSWQNGIYFVKIKKGTYTETRKVVK
jgi:hypothetical protein